MKPVKSWDRTVSLDTVRDARRRLGGRVRRTPLVHSAWLSALTRAEVWLKLETLQRTSSFKIRGALNAALALAERGGTGPLVTASAGNHGRALAEAARDAGMACVVFTPANAPRTKLDAIRAAGARLDSRARDYDEAEAAAGRHAAETGAQFISAYNHPDVIAGAGTVALEILDERPDADDVVVPVGGGGLMSGMALAIRTVSPACRMIGVEAALNPAFRVARAHARITPIPVAESLADGLGGNLEAGSITFDLVERYVQWLTDADEPSIAAAIAALAFEEHLVVEGAGAVGVAALAAGRLTGLEGRRVVVVISGANIDRARLADVLAGHVSR
jgi:threonine dehydratase